MMVFGLFQLLGKKVRRRRAGHGALSAVALGVGQLVASGRAQANQHQKCSAWPFQYFLGIPQSGRQLRGATE